MYKGRLSAPLAFSLAAVIVAAATAATVGVHDAVATATAQQDQQDDDPPAAVTTKAIVIAHTNTSVIGIWQPCEPLIPWYSPTGIFVQQATVDYCAGASVYWDWVL